MERTISIDALPLLFKGGISKYTAPLVENFITQYQRRWRIELLCRLSLAKARRLACRRLLLGPARGAVIKKIYLPDRLTDYLWGKGCTMPALTSRRDRDVFIATTDMVPTWPKIKVGWIVHDLVHLRLPQFFDLDPKAVLAFKKKRAQRADFIIVNSCYTMQDVVEYLGFPQERICLLYPGIDPPVAAVGREAEPAAAARPYIYYLGALAPNKNVDGMLRVFARCVHEYHLDLDLVISGRDFCGAAYWSALLESLGIGERVRFTGWVDGTRRENLLRNARMLWQFSWYEGFGLPVLEAASRGIPVLCSNRGAGPEILQNPNQIIDPADEEATALQAARVLNSPQTLCAWKKNGLEQAARFSWVQSALMLGQWINANL